MPPKLLALLLLLCSGAASAELPGVLRWDVQQDFNRTYREVYRALEDNRFFVIFEANIGRNLRGYAAREGEDYNRGGVDQIRAMLFCNVSYTNQVSIQDPNMLSICPLHITLYQKGPTTSILFERPTQTGQGSPAMPLLKEIETQVSKAIESGINAANTR
jgi:uncharacterized protein (DUF302 family)